MTQQFRRALSYGYLIDAAGDVVSVVGEPSGPNGIIQWRSLTGEPIENPISESYALFAMLQRPKET